MMVSSPRFRVFLSYVVLAHDDEDDLRDVLPQIDAFLAAHFDRHEIIVVDNGSTDATQAMVAELGTGLSGTLVHMQLSRSHDSERAMLAGLARAVGDFVIETEHLRGDWEPSLLLELFERCAQGVDTVDATNGPPSWSRRQFFDALNRFSYLEIPSHPVSIRIVSRRALNAMLDMREKVRYRRALYAATGLPSAVVSYDPGPDRATIEERRGAHNVRRAMDVMVSFSDVGLRLANLAALAFAGVAALAVLYTLVVFAVKRDVATGWTTLMLMVSFGFAGLFVVLSLLGEYISRLLIEVRHRPPYNLRAVTVFASHDRDDRLPLADMGTQLDSLGGPAAPDPGEIEPRAPLDPVVHPDGPGNDR